MVGGNGTVNIRYKTEIQLTPNSFMISKLISYKSYENDISLK